MAKFRHDGATLAGHCHIMKITALTAGLSIAALFCTVAASPTVDLDLAKDEVSRCYARARPEVQEFVLHTARSFGTSGLWLNENAHDVLKPGQREARVVYLRNLFAEAEYGRHLCAALAEASAFKDARLVAGLLKAASYHVDNKGYDCRPK